MPYTSQQQDFFLENFLLHVLHDYTLVESPLIQLLIIYFFHRVYVCPYLNSVVSFERPHSFLTRENLLKLPVDGPEHFHLVSAVSLPYTIQVLTMSSIQVRANEKWLLHLNSLCMHNGLKDFSYGYYSE